MDAFTVHGGRLGEAKRRFPGAPEPWIDLSTGINPAPYPAPSASWEARTRLPDPEELAALEAAAAQAFGVKPECVLATPGEEAAIRLLAAAIPAARVGVVEPTYAGHRQAWRGAGAEVVSVRRSALDMAPANLDVLAVVNPNNPDGASASPDMLVELAEAMAARGGWLIVDEAFVETVPQLNVSSRVGPDWTLPRLVALRSFGKFYGLPGLRLGFVTGHPELIVRLRRRLGDWPVSADAIIAGRHAYADAAWAEATRERLAEGARRLDRLLAGAGFEIVGGCNLFRLAAADDAPARFIRLAQAGILTRPFTDEPRWLRFGAPAQDHWPRLEAALLEDAP
jgi:cobalamin biosynthetic protein CobC